MDTKFSVAVHILIMISESPEPINSDFMAKSVGTNASYIRKILALLKKAGIVESHKGISRYSLCVSPKELTLLSIYKGVNDESEIHILDIHQNANDKCIVGKHIKPVLEDMFESVEQSFFDSLENKTLYDCISDIKKQAFIKEKI